MEGIFVIIIACVLTSIFAFVPGLNQPAFRELLLFYTGKEVDDEHGKMLMQLVYVEESEETRSLMESALVADKALQIRDGKTVIVKEEPFTKTIYPSDSDAIQQYLLENGLLDIIETLNWQKYFLRVSVRDGFGIQDRHFIVDQNRNEPYDQSAIPTRADIGKGLISELESIESLNAPRLTVTKLPYKRRSTTQAGYQEELDIYNGVMERIYPQIIDQVRAMQRQSKPKQVQQTREVIVSGRDEIDAMIDDRISAIIAILPESRPKLFLHLWFASLRAHFVWIMIVSVTLGLLIGSTLKPLIQTLYMPVVRFFDHGRMGFGGAARFASYIEEWKYLKSQNKKGILLGRSMYNPYLDLAMDDDRHMLTIAASRGGKGTTAIIPNLLKWEGSCIVIDPKGTNAAVTARRRKELGQNVYVIDPFGITDHEASSFNPLQGLDPDSDTIREDIDIIVDALVVLEPDKKGDDHWSQGAKTIIRGFLAHIISHEDFADRVSINTIREFFSYDDDQRVALLAQMSMNFSAGNIARETSARVITGIQTDEMASILSSANAQTEWLASKAIQSSLSTEANFDFGEIKQTPTTIYLVIPPEYLKDHKRFVRLFINLAIRQMYKGGRSKIPVLMMIDEFLSLGRMEEVANAFSLVAGYNLVLWPFVQEMGSFQKLYGSEVEAFIGNSRAVQVFSASDKPTAEFISERLGSRSLKGGLEASSSGNLPLRSSSDVRLELDSEMGKQYILRAGKFPLLLEKVPYFRISWCQKLLSKLGIKFKRPYDPDPDYK
ncbi:type IV secretory system conjugative DNA transfer family protein [Cerasicoccus frondis]|uniref:type IV secretory system conjugative DNA transfer family protein n=1 Tax=Cerasicoccus frondis TaxID=490090 RepID=UPI002852C16B|nr:type IV secretory system conjugative DNA transfer family protein [Cerasicoccus frondis]